MSPRSRRPGRQRGPGFKEYLLAMVLTIVMGLVAGIVVGEVYAPRSVIDLGSDPTAIEPSDTPGFSSVFSFTPRLQGPLNVLVMATDVNYTVRNGRRVLGLTGNTDTMVLARFDPASGQVRALSIPRDTRVSIPGHGVFKINAANPYGGPVLAAQVVADFLGVQVDRYVLLNTRAVVQIVDALGGIEVFVPKRMVYHDYAGNLHINLQKGWNVLNGRSAHDFLRFRHDELGDIGRVQRQQAFVQAVLKKFLMPSVLLKTPELLEVAQENLETNLSQEELLKLITLGKDLSRERVQMSMVPGVPTNIDGVSYWVADERTTRRMVEQFLVAEVAAEPLSANNYSVAIRDGVGDRSAVRALKAEVSTLGYGRVDIDGLAPQLGLAETQVIAQNADLAGARRLAESLGFGKVVVAATGNIHSDFTIVIGRDWLQRLAERAINNSQ
ncbi:MAG: LCP family protein [Candidatus Sericytochromatia bacterium]|nr:LCP family protein [Candidatus Sericytochromatia bacterium]